MKIPMAKGAAAVLKGMYRDRAVVKRCDIAEGDILTKIVYDGQICHLSGKRGAGQISCSAFEQTEGNGEAKISLAVFFPPECDIRAGDLITVFKGERSFSGRAGMPVFGQMAVRVTINGIEPA